MRIHKDDRQELRAHLGDFPSWTPTGRERSEVELDATAIVRTVEIEKRKEIRQPGALLNVRFVRRVIERDPGENIILNEAYPIDRGLIGAEIETGYCFVVLDGKKPKIVRVTGCYVQGARVFENGWWSLPVTGAKLDLAGKMETMLGVEVSAEEFLRVVLNEGFSAEDLDATFGQGEPLEFLRVKLVHEINEAMEATPAAELISFLEMLAESSSVPTFEKKFLGSGLVVEAAQDSIAAAAKNMNLGALMGLSELVRA